MIWDCLIAWVVIVCTLVGWSIGLVRSWTVPISLALATFVSQHIYIDLAAILSENCRLEATLAVCLAYALTWLWIAQYCDSFLSRLVRTHDASQLLILKLGGGALGFVKGLAPFVLATMVASVQNQVPEPADICQADLWMVQAASDSFLLPAIQKVANKLDQPLSKFVLCKSAPRINPTTVELISDPFAEMKKKEQHRGVEIMESWKRLQNDLQNQ